MDESNTQIIETEKILTGEFFFNIALHVTILFTILSLFFVKRIKANVSKMYLIKVGPLKLKFESW